MGGAQLVGRDRELAALGAALDDPAVAGVLLVGDAGIGKSALLAALGEACRARSWTVLAALPTSRETALPFAGLRDVVGPLWPQVADFLAPPLRDALAAALLRAEVPGRTPDMAAVGVAATEALESALAAGPVLLLLDDLQWLDASSAHVLSFAARRARGAHLVVAGAVRLGPDGEPPAGLAQLLPDPVTEVVLGALDPEVTRSLVGQHTGPDASPADVAHLSALSGGNPLHALELARAYRRRQVRGHDTALPAGVPASLRALLDERLDAMPPEVVATLTVVAALAEPDEQVLVRTSTAVDVHVAVAQQAGLVRRQHGEVVFTHPLLGERLYERLEPEDRRSLHARIAVVASTELGRAWHRGLAAPGPDAGVAADLDRAARRARAQGAPDVAARLAELAMRLTPPDDLDARVERALVAADNLAAGADHAAAQALLQPLASVLPAGPLRARVRATLAWIGPGSADDVTRLREAADEAAADPAVEAGVRYWYARVVTNTATPAAGEAEFRRVEQLAESAGLAELALVARRDQLFLAASRGEPVEDARLAGLVAPGGWEGELYEHPDLIRAYVACWSDRLDRADRLIEGLLRRAQDQGQLSSAGGLLVHLAEVRIRQGRFVEAEQLARQAHALAYRAGGDQATCYVLGHALAHLGRHEAARAAAGQGLRMCREGGDRLFLMQNLLVLGFLGICTARWPDTVDAITEAREVSSLTGWRHPGLFRWDGDLAEALVALDRLEEAESVIKDLTARAQSLGLDVPMAVAGRGEALRQAALGDLDASLRCARAAAEGHDPDCAPFDAARARLVLGTVERRCRHRAAARRALEHAATEFSRMGAVAWASRARDELARTEGAAAGGELSQTERRVCALAAAGRRNREIAAELYISEKTVESHLSSAYRKLGVRSRAQLARRLPPADPPPPAP